jgi:hypothetical protein
VTEFPYGKARLEGGVKSLVQDCREMCEGYTDSCWLARTLPQGPALLSELFSENERPEAPTEQRLRTVFNQPASPFS